MHLGRKFFAIATIALILGTSQAASAADPKDAVLRKLDAAAKNFRSASAEFDFDSVTTDPVRDEEVQDGTVYYQRDGKGFRMAAHIREVDHKPVPKIYVYADGAFKLYEKKINQVTTISKASQFESYLMLGFGASGKEIEDKFEVKYLGSETLQAGKVSVKTEKLELVAKDSGVRQKIPKITIWVDPERGVSLKQVFDQGPGQYRVNVYFDLKVNDNKSIPRDAFTFPTDKETNFIRQ